MKNLFTSKGAFLCLIAFSLTCISTNISAQSGGRISQKVLTLKQKNSFAVETALFSVAGNQGRAEVTKIVKRFTLLDLKNNSELLSAKPEFLNFTIPGNNGASPLRVLLYKESISPNGFTLLSSEGKIEGAGEILHYKGAVDGLISSVAAFSFSENEVSGMIGTNDGNLVVGKLSGTTQHIIYNDKDIINKAPFDCGTNTNIPLSPGNFYRGDESTSSLTTKCVDWYWETDVDLFTAKGSLANVNTYMQGIFNQVQTLYANDGISVTLRTLFVWTTTDPYTGTSTSGLLDQFGAYRTSFDGDLATLIGTKGSGGIAWINSLCNNQNKYKMAYCGISTSYSNVPSYSWTVEVITHEIGHNLGSRHTHDCVWNGNNTKIDGCGDSAGYTSGTCPVPSPALPAGGGTIMSYCHLTSAGINFNLGFGTQPKALIINNINNASCLTNCSSGCTTPAQPEAISGNTSVCPGTAQTYSVVAVAGATSYTWSLPSGWSGSSTTNSINVTAGSTAGSVSVTAVNSCGSGTARTLSVTGLTTPAQPSTISGNAAVCAGTAQTYSIPATSGATSYTWTLPSGWSGTSTTTTINTTSGSTGGNITVRANNNCGSGTIRSFAVSITASTPGQPGNISGATNVCPGASQTFSVAAVSGASTYTWTLPSGWSGSSTTNSISVTAGSTGGNLSVSASNGCGTSALRTLAVTTGGSAPVSPGTITVSGGTAAICTGNTRTYSVAAVAGLTYNWTAATGMTINSGQGTASISVTFTTAFASPGNLTVTATNSCGTGPASSITISKAVISTPGSITTTGGIPKVCSGDTRTYSVSAVAGITYNWTVPAGANINSGQGSSSINVSYTPNFTTNGTLSVRANNACGTSNPRNLTIVRNLPGAPAPISGPATICTGSTGTYSVPVVANATGYQWTIPAGGVAQGAVNGNTISILWTGTRGGSLSVRTINNCGYSGSRSLKIIISCARGDAGMLMETTTKTEIFPNPTNSIANVRFYSKDRTSVTVSVTDMAGKILHTEKLQAIAGMNTHQLNMSAFAKGSYIILIESRASKQALKLNVQ